jgi:putative SOS response-associated peptidase YedK
MCYTIEKNLTREELEKRFGKNFKPNRPYSPGKRVSGFEFPEVPVIKLEDPDTIDLLNWGLIPFWTKNTESANAIKTKTLNARAETLIEKPSFRHTIKSKRCLVLTNGFYEWQHDGKTKTLFFIYLKNDIAMPMAGLYDEWTNSETGEIFCTFTIITTKANALMEKIHNTKKRMPVILSREKEFYWTDPHTNAEKALDLLVPCEDKLLEAVQIEEGNTNKPKTSSQKTLF